MSDANIGTCAVVLSGGAAASVAPPLAKLFGIEARLAGQIAGAAPIVLVDNLSTGQAAGVSAALAEMTAAGARLEIKAASDLGSLPRVGWPGGPKINGRAAAEYTAPAAAGAGSAADGQLRCPCCGAALRLIAAQGGAPAPAAAAAAPAAAPAGRREAKDSGFEEIPLPDALKSLDAVSSELPDVPELPEPKPVKVKAEPPPAPPAVKGAISMKNAKPGSSAPMALEDFEAGLASDDQMMADLDDGLPQVPDEKAKPVPAAPPRPAALPAPISLDEITVQPEAGRPAAAVPKAKAVKPMTPQQAARQVVAKPAAPVAKPATAVPAAPAPKPATAAPAAAPATAASGDPNEKVNIYINKTANPKVHELVAKLHNVSVEDAAALCDKTLVTVARGISRGQAETIRKKLAEYKVSARLSAVRLSQRTSADAGTGEA
ncbi:MAG TPA: hypothetical protein PK280_09825 [Planctomycetota bacterium]|nr:hypothetical protein [Planctomycetota bacterium]